MGEARIDGKMVERIVGYGLKYTRDTFDVVSGFCIVVPEKPPSGLGFPDMVKNRWF